MIISSDVTKKNFNRKKEDLIACNVYKNKNYVPM